MMTHNLAGCIEGVISGRRVIDSSVARPLRFRYDTSAWSDQRIHRKIFRDLDGNIGATQRRPWYAPPGGFTIDRFDMDNGDIAFFIRGPNRVFWLGNTETPRALWQTDKMGFDAVPRPLHRWATRELTAQLHDETPWLASFPAVSRFFLPVFLSKDGRDSSRQFFNDHAAGFPDASRDDALSHLEAVLHTGVFDDDREIMAGKLGTSKGVDFTRMTAAMGEFNIAKLLVDAGYALEPEAPVTTGHSIDFRVNAGAGSTLVEVTRPLPPQRRSASSPVRAIKDTASVKSNGQLAQHGGGVLLVVDCSSFRRSEWQMLLEQQPAVGHRPAAVVRYVPGEPPAGYTIGSMPIDLQLQPG